jgi:hypothetical protein
MSKAVEAEAPPVLSVPEAGWRYLRLSKSASYRAVEHGVIPTIRFGSRLLVPVVAMERLLSEAGAKPVDAKPPTSNKPRKRVRKAR